MPFSAATLQAFHSIVGDQGFVTDPHQMAPFLVESRNRFQGHCDVLLKPSTVQEVSEILSVCDDQNIPVVPQGGNTGHCGGAVPEGGVLLNLSRLNKIREVDVLNGTMTVDSGCILQTIQDRAAEVDMLFPLSLAAEGSCQIGGNLATNAGGVHVLRYGNMRDLTLGLEVVLPDGQIWDGLRGLRKDNSGYDLKHLFIGSEGTLGVITGAVLKLFPRTEQTACALIATNSLSHLMDVFERLRGEFSQLLNAYEIVPHFGIEMVQRHFPDITAPFKEVYQWYGVVELAATRSSDTVSLAFENSLEALMEQGLLENAILAQDLEQAHKIWELRELMSSAQKREGGSIKHDVSVPVSKIVDFITEATQACQNYMGQARVCAFGHVGDGNIHFNVSQPIDMDKDAFLIHWETMNEIVHELVEAYGGSFSAEHGVGQLKLREMSVYRGGPELDMMQRIKRAFDPQNIMNPGKVVPGLIE